MATKGRSHKIFGINSTYEANGDIINGDVSKVFNFYINKEASYEFLTNKKDNFSEFYKKFISKFEKLDDYAFSLFYPGFYKKDFDFDNETLMCGKRIIDWVYGFDEFPIEEIQKFYEVLKIDFKFDDSTILVKRWNANIAYFNNNLKLANENYSNLYDELSKCENVPEWFLDDICIDGSGLLHQHENMINKFSLVNKFQNRLCSNEHKLSYPDIDRIKSEIFEIVSKNVFNNKNKSKYTSIYGSFGLKDCFKKIQDLVFLTIFYGSIVNLKRVRLLISNIMYIYADTFEDEKFYDLTLKMLFLSGDFKKFRNLYNKIRLNYFFVINEQFINSIFNSRKALFKFEEDMCNVFLFDIYGRYIDDDLYVFLEKKMFNILTILDDYNSIISDTFKAIANNIKRSKNIGELLLIIKKYIAKSKIMFYIDFVKILREINVDELNNSEFKNYKDIVDSLLKEKEQNDLDLSGCIIKIKKRSPKITKYDAMLNKQGTHENIVYQIELKNSDLEIVKNIVNVYKERHEQNENNSGVHYGFSTDYRIGTNIFTPSKYTNELKNYILQEYLPLSKSVILSENESIYEKIRHIKLLSHLLMIEKDENVKNDVIDFVHKVCNIKYFDSFYIGDLYYRDQTDLIINVAMFDVIVDIRRYEEVLCLYLEYAITSPSNIEEILNCLHTLNQFFTEKNDDIIDKLFLIFICSYEVNDFDIRIATIIMSDVFIGTKYQNRVLEILLKRLDNMTFEEVKGYIQLIMNADEDKRKIYSDIIEKLKTNNNYYVKYMVRKFL